jgi:hypothetical protein
MESEHWVVAARGVVGMAIESEGEMEGDILH